MNDQEVKNLITSKYEPEKTIIKEEHTLEQSHLTPNQSAHEVEVKFDADLADQN